ncbi:MAG: hypothetical protein ABI895_33300 [Deltaproteobacteria bacterium]
MPTTESAQPVVRRWTSRWRSRTAYWSHRAYHAELMDLSAFGWFAHYVYFEHDEPLPLQR